MRTLLLSLVVLLALPTLAVAQNQKEAASKAFDVADKAYRAGDYDRAAKEFLTAYQLAPINALLFNIGQAYRMQGDKEKALAYYEKYVEFEPAGAQIPEAKQHIGELKEAVETVRREREARAAEEAARRAEKEAQERAAADKLKAAELLRSRAEADQAGSGLRVGGLVVGGLGVAALGVGIAIAAGGTTGAGLALGGAGVAAIGGGTAMYLIGKKQQSDARARVGAASLIVPTVTPGGAGLVWAGTF